jgi:hypothetical protein
MGGQSTSSLTIENGVAHFEGDCAIVPFLKAPGFITMETGGFRMPKEVFPDVSSCQALSLILKSNSDYTGYRVSFGNERLPFGFHAVGYKAPMTDLPSSGDFEDVILPFDMFSSKWDEKTGDIEIECADDAQYCPSPKWLRNMETMSFWGEGVAGTVDLEIQQIRAVGCADEVLLPVLGRSVSTPQRPLALFLAVAMVAFAAVVSLLVHRQRRGGIAYAELDAVLPEHTF